MTQITIPNEAGQGLNPAELKQFATWVVRGDKVELLPFDDTNVAMVDWVTMRHWWEEQGRPEPGPLVADDE